MFFFSWGPTFKELLFEPWISREFLVSCFFEFRVFSIFIFADYLYPQKAKCICFSNIYFIRQAKGLTDDGVPIHKFYSSYVNSAAIHLHTCIYTFYDYVYKYINATDQLCFQARAVSCSFKSGLSSRM